MYQDPKTGYWHQDHAGESVMCSMANCMNQKRIVDVQPATTSAPRRYVYADGTLVEIHYGPRTGWSNGWGW